MYWVMRSLFLSSTATISPTARWHADEIAGQGPADEVSLHLHRAPHDVLHDVLRQLVLQHASQGTWEPRNPTRRPYSKQAKSACSPSSRAINSLEKARPGMRPRFFNQKRAQKEPLNRMPSTAAKATKRSAKPRKRIGARS